MGIKAATVEMDEDGNIFNLEEYADEETLESKSDAIVGSEDSNQGSLPRLIEAH